MSFKAKLSKILFVTVLSINTILLTKNYLFFNKGFLANLVSIAQFILPFGVAFVVFYVSFNHIINIYVKILNWFLKRSKQKDIVDIVLTSLIPLSIIFISNYILLIFDEIILFYFVAFIATLVFFLVQFILLSREYGWVSSLLGSICSVILLNLILYLFTQILALILSTIDEKIISFLNNMVGKEPDVVWGGLPK